MSRKHESDDLLNSVSNARGYSLALHEVLAKHDPDALAGYEQMMRALYLSDRRLDGKTKELVYVAVLVALGAAEQHIVGVARANTGFDMWCRMFGDVSGTS
jgi:4-carboxymuconolactone decarboxylase